MRRIVDSLYRDSGVDTRHSVVVDSGDKTLSRFYSFHCAPSAIEPSTKKRNDYFIQASGPLAVTASARLLQNSRFKARDITHLITVSCTGFSNPGMDFDVADQLGLADTTERYHVGFMGCYGAFPALRMAQQFCLAHPESVVLIVCVELCSLHFHFNDDLDTLLANSLFADGVGAAMVSARNPEPTTSVFVIKSFSRAVFRSGQKDMAWTIGDHGFDIVLSKYVPRIIGENIRLPVERTLRENGLEKKDVAVWALHPGGKSILDKFQKSLDLEPHQLDVSRRILNRFGNMSAATIFFVLKDILEQPPRGGPEPVFAAAFGPGLSAETAVLIKDQGEANGSHPQARI